MKNIILSCVVMLLTACSPHAVPFKEKMLVNKSFVYLYYPSVKDCMDAQPDPDFFLNCHQQVDFYPNNIVEIMLSDIYYRGTYLLRGNLVILTFEPGPEIPDGEIIFEILNPAKLLYLENGTVWKKVSGNSIWNGSD